MQDFLDWCLRFSKTMKKNPPEISMKTLFKKIALSFLIITKNSFVVLFYLFGLFALSQQKPQLVQRNLQSEVHRPAGNM